MQPVSNVTVVISCEFKRNVNIFWGVSASVIILLQSANEFVVLWLLFCLTSIQSVHHGAFLAIVGFVTWFRLHYGPEDISQTLKTGQ